MIRRLGFVFVFLICLPAFSWATSTYSDYSLGEKTPIVTEGFLNNNNGWSVGRFGKGCRSASIENGVYRIQSHCDKEYPEFWIGSVGIDEGRDFEIETRVRFVKGDSNGFYGLTWGSGIARDDKGPYRYRFGLSSNGKYTIDEYSGRWEDKKKWTKSDLIKKSAFNLLTIRKVKTDYHFFINKKYVHTSSFEPFYGPRVGFQVGQNSIIEIDKLSVSYLASSSPHLYSEYSNAQKELLFKDDFKINAKKWAEGTFGNESRRAVVKNGVYELSSLKPDSYPLFWNNGIDIDGDRDFEIEAKIRFVKGVDNNANSIFWGGGVVVWWCGG